MKYISYLIAILKTYQPITLAYANDKAIDYYMP